MNYDNYSTIISGVGGGFFGGPLLGYALKKVVKIIAVVVGLFLAGLAYLQYQQITFVNWSLNDYSIETLAMTNLGTPLTGGMSAGFAIGFVMG